MKQKKYEHIFHGALIFIYMALIIFIVSWTLDLQAKQLISLHNVDLTFNIANLECGDCISRYSDRVTPHTTENMSVIYVESMHNLFEIPKAFVMLGIMMPIALLGLLSSFYSFERLSKKKK